MKLHESRSTTTELDELDKGLIVAIVAAASLALGLTVAIHGPSWTRATQIEPVLLGEVGLWSETFKR